MSWLGIAFSILSPFVSLSILLNNLLVSSVWVALIFVTSSFYTSFSTTSLFTALLSSLKSLGVDLSYQYLINQ